MSGLIVAVVAGTGATGRKARTVNVPLLDLKAQHAPLKAQLMQAVEQVLESGQFVGGPLVRQLEQALAAHSGCAAGVGVSSGTDAILSVLMALGIGGGGLFASQETAVCGPAERSFAALWRLGEGSGVPGILLSRPQSEIQSRKLLTTVVSGQSNGKYRVMQPRRKAVSDAPTDSDAVADTGLEEAPWNIRGFAKHCRRL